MKTTIIMKRKFACPFTKTSNGSMKNYSVLRKSLTLSSKKYTCFFLWMRADTKQAFTKYLNTDGIINTIHLRVTHAQLAEPFSVQEMHSSFIQSKKTNLKMEE